MPLPRSMSRSGLGWRGQQTAILYLPQMVGGLNLPLISVLYKRLQVARQSQLLTSPDPCSAHGKEGPAKRPDSQTTQIQAECGGEGGDGRKP